MFRGALLLCVASGCDLVFEAVPSQLPTCGVFNSAEPQVFADALSDVRELSVDATGTRGIVHAVTAANPDGGIEAVSLVDGVWQPDAMGGNNFRDLERMFFVQSGRMSQKGDMFASELPREDFAFRVFRWKLSNNAWVRQEGVTPQIPNESTFAGGEIEVDVDTLAFFREVPIIHLDAGFQRFMAIAQSDPGQINVWHEALDDRGRRITAAINDVVDARSAALAFGRDKRVVLVYAATERGEDAGSRIYITEKRNGVFAPGVPLRQVEDAVDGGELLEPHLTADCSALYFRRRVSATDPGTIFKSPNLDPPPATQ